MGGQDADAGGGDAAQPRDGSAPGTALPLVPGAPTGDLVGRAGVDVDAAVEVMAPVPYSTGTLLMIVISAIWLVITDPVLGALAPSSSRC